MMLWQWSAEDCRVLLASISRGANLEVGAMTAWRNREGSVNPDAATSIEAIPRRRIFSWWVLWSSLSAYWFGGGRELQLVLGSRVGVLVLSFLGFSSTPDGSIWSISQWVARLKVPCIESSKEATWRKLLHLMVALYCCFGYELPMNKRVSV